MDAKTVRTFNPRTSKHISELLGAPVSHPLPDMPDGFYAKGSLVCYRSGYRHFLGDAVEKACEEILLVAMSVKSNHGDVLQSEQVAELIAAALNRYREEDLENRGIRRTI